MGSLITPVSIIGVLVKLLAGHADINKPQIEKIRQRETSCCVPQFIVKLLIVANVFAANKMHRYRFIVLFYRHCVMSDVIITDTY